jgi:hypothetical protein
VQALRRLFCRYQTTNCSAAKQMERTQLFHFQKQVRIVMPAVMCRLQRDVD